MRAEFLTVSAGPFVTYAQGIPMFLGLRDLRDLRDTNRKKKQGTGVTSRRKTDFNALVQFVRIGVGKWSLWLLCLLFVYFFIHLVICRHGSVRFSGARFHLRSPSTGSRMYRLTSTTQWRCYWCYETVADNRTVADNSSLHKVLPKMLTSTQLPASHLTNRTKSYMIIMIIIPWSIVSYCIPMKYPQIPMIDGETW
jgi:hypothetical protein